MRMASRISLMCIWNRIRKSDVEAVFIVLPAVLNQNLIVLKGDVFWLIAAYWSPIIMDHLCICAEGQGYTDAENSPYVRLKIEEPR